MECSPINTYSSKIRKKYVGDSKKSTSETAKKLRKIRNISLCKVQCFIGILGTDKTDSLT